jgi:hypothetical protein
MDAKIKHLFATFTENTEKKLAEQSEKHVMQIAEIKQTTIEAHNLLTHKTMATQSQNDHRASTHFTPMTKACNVPFDGQPENWPAFESPLLNEANEILQLQLMDQTAKPFN